MTTLHCKAPSRFAFTPGRAYTARAGGLTPAGYYVDLSDDAGATQRFGLKPRRGVRNEHALIDLEPAFTLPAPSDLSQFEYVWQEITRGHYDRPLIIAPRFGPESAERWVLTLKRLASTEVRQLVRPGDYNALCASGTLPIGIYVTHLRDLFMTWDGNPAPAILGAFDFLYVCPTVR
jgi:hypothetical protein